MKKILIVLLACAVSVHAETKIWLGGDGAFETPEQWSGAVVPAAGDSVVISNGAVTVTPSDSFTGLVSVVLGEDGKLVCSQTVETDASVTFNASNVLEVSAGELVFHGYASGIGFFKEGPGTVRFTGRNSSFTTWLPGLREERLSGSFDLTSSNTGTRVSAGLEMANTTWPSEDTATTYAYTGEIYLDGSDYSFAEHIDDNVYLSIDGTAVLSNQSYTTISTGSIQRPAGWYPIDLRLGNGAGTGGSLGVYSTGGGVGWKKDGTAWQMLRDFSGGAFLRSPGKVAARFSDGVLIATGTVSVCTDTAADSADSEEGNSLGGVTLDAGTLMLSNTVCRAASFNGASNALLRLDLAGLTLTNEADCFYPGKTAGVGTWIKDGTGRLEWATRSASQYAHSATVVNEGLIALGSSDAWLGDLNFGTFTVNTYGTVETFINGNTQFSCLWGDGTLTNTTTSGGPWQLRITVGPSEFSGQIHGNIRYYSQGLVALTGTNSTFPGNFAIHSQGGAGITGVKKIGLSGQPSSAGSGSDIHIREKGGTLRYLGTGETTDKTFLFYPSDNRVVIDGGLYGGVTFNGSWSTSGGRLVRLAVIGTNEAPCVFNGAYNEHSQYGTNYSTYIAKEGPGTWIFKSNSGRSNRGVIDVRDGTLQFESIAEAGTICSLGRSDLLFSDTISSVTNGLGVSYAFSLGTDSTVGTLEYIGAGNAACNTRQLVLQGNGRLKSDSASLAFAGGVRSLTSGAKTLYLDGSATNTLGFVSDGAGTVGITKEGAGTWKLSTTNAFSGPLTVQAGELVLDKRGYVYYRFSLLQRNYNILPTSDTNIELTELALYSADGVRRNLNLVKNGTNNVAQLNPGEFCPMGSYPTYANRTDINLFDDSTSSQWTVNTVNFLPGTPISLVMRLADDTPAITGYDLQYWPATSNRFLSAWSIEGSRDGVVWDTLDSVSDFVPISPAALGGSVKWWYSTGTVTPGNGFAVADGSLTNAQLMSGVQVSVAADAALTVLGGTEALSSLSVDCDAGGGTISELTLAETGRIDLTLTPLQGLNFAIPLTVETFDNPEVLKNWSLYINGQLIQGAGVRWDTATGTLWVYPFGTFIMIQ